MPMTVVVTRNVAPRFRGFLASCMLEIAPGVYTSPRMTKAIRQRMWQVCEQWYEELCEGSLVITWRDPKEECGQGVLLLGEPAKDLRDHEGLLVVRGELTEKKERGARV